MGNPRYFLGIEGAYQKHGLLLSQRKYTLDLLEKTDMLGCKPASTLMEANVDYGVIIIIYSMTLDSIGD